jgi:hypothetical protein
MCDLEASRMRVPASGFCARGKNQLLNNFVITRKFAANWDLSILKSFPVFCKQYTEK